MPLNVLTVGNKPWRYLKENHLAADEVFTAKNSEENTNWDQIEKEKY